MNALFVLPPAGRSLAAKSNVTSDRAHIAARLQAARRVRRRRRALALGLSAIRKARRAAARLAPTAPIGEKQRL